MGAVGCGPREQFPTLQLHLKIKVSMETDANLLFLLHLLIFFLKGKCGDQATWTLSEPFFFTEDEFDPIFLLLLFSFWMGSYNFIKNSVPVFYNLSSQMYSFLLKSAVFSQKCSIPNCSAVNVQNNLSKSGHIFWAPNQICERLDTVYFNIAF